MLAFLFDFYHVLFVIFAYSLLNLTVSLIAHFRKKNTPGNNYVYIGTLFSLGTIPLLFLYYHLAIAAWFVAIVLYYSGAKMNHEANDDTTPLFYLFSLTIAAFITFALFLLHL
jgi:hypothetical protein